MPFLLVLRKTWIAFRHLVQSKRRRRQRSFFFSVAILGSLVLLQTKHMHTVSTTPETVYSLNHGQAIEDSAPSLTWEFHGYSQSNIPARSTSPSIPRLLIAQYASAFYTVVLNETQRVNQAYAERFNHDFIVCRGIYLTDSPWWRLVSPPLHTIAGSRSTYNKIAVLAYAMQHDYDRVLILDSDAMVRDFSINMATYSLTDDKGKDVVVVAQQDKMGEVHPPNTWNVNIGVTLWNLRHEQVVTLWQQWHDRSIARIRSGQADDDQQPLQRCFRAFPDTTRPVLAVKEFGYGGGSIVQHFIRESSSSWSEPTEARTEGIRTAARKIVPK